MNVLYVISLNSQFLKRNAIWILTAIDNIVAPKVELAIRSINASSGQDVTSVTANPEHGEHVGSHASFEKASGTTLCYMYRM